VTALSGVIFMSPSLIVTSSSASAAALAATSESRWSNKARRSARYSAAVAGTATGNGPAARMAVNNAGGMS
jgi:hypothetical protein